MLDLPERRNNAMGSLERDKQQSNAQSSREKLIEELRKHYYLGINCDYEAIADFILKDRERICAPLVKYKEIWGICEGYNSDEAIKETLRLAGIE